VAQPTIEYQEENLNILNVEDPDTVLLPEITELDFEASSEEDPPIVAELCDCRFSVSQNNGLICFGMVCSDSCPEHTRACASLIGGCTLRR